MAEYYNPYADDEAKITRRRRMAEMLGAQAMEPIEQSSFRGIPAPISPAAGLAKALTAFASVKGGQRADAESAALKGKRTADADADYTDLLAAMKGGRLDPETGSRLRTPEARSSFLDLYGKQKPEEKPKPTGSPFELAGEDGSVVKWQMLDNGQMFQLGRSAVEAKAPKPTGSPVTLAGEGGRPIEWQQYDDGTMTQLGLAYTPPKEAVERKTDKDVNGVLRYVDTGEPVFQNVTRTNDSLAVNKAENAFKSWQTKVNGTTSAIDKALEMLDWTTTGLVGGALRFGPTDARTVNNLITQIQANLGFEELNEMRANSPTGGALGNVTEKETALLQATRGVLDPMDPDLPNKLKNIKKLYGQLMAERAAAMEKDKAAMTRGGPQNLTPAAERSLDELLQKYGG